MKKVSKIISLLAIVTLVLAVCMFPASAANKLPFLTKASVGNADGGYLALGGTITLADFGTKGGFSITSSGTVQDDGVWAFTDATVDAYPYLVYSVATPDTIDSIMISHNWGVELDGKADKTAGFHCINLKEALASQTSNTYYYVAIWLTGATASFDYMYLSDTAVDANGDSTGETPVKTGAETAVAAGVTLAVAGLATVVICSKKSK